MYSQEKIRQMKAFEKQEKQLKEMKAAGKSTKQAVRFCAFVFYVSLMKMLLGFCSCFFIAEHETCFIEVG